MSTPAANVPARSTRVLKMFGGIDVIVQVILTQLVLSKGNSIYLCLIKE